MGHLSHLVRYYDHLYTLTGGKLHITSSVVLLFGVRAFQIRLEAEWNGKHYGYAYREISDRVPGNWGSPEHLLVYQAACMLRDLCRSLESHGCEYAIPQY